MKKLLVLLIVLSVVNGLYAQSYPFFESSSISSSDGEPTANFSNLKRGVFVLVAVSYRYSGSDPFSSNGTLSNGWTKIMDASNSSGKTALVVFGNFITTDLQSLTFNKANVGYSSGNFSHTITSIILKGVENQSFSSRTSSASGSSSSLRVVSPFVNSNSAKAKTLVLAFHVLKGGQLSNFNSSGTPTTLVNLASRSSFNPATADLSKYPSVVLGTYGINSTTKISQGSTFSTASANSLDYVSGQILVEGQTPWVLSTNKNSVARCGTFVLNGFNLGTSDNQPTVTIGAAGSSVTVGNVQLSADGSSLTMNIPSNAPTGSSVPVTVTVGTLSTVINIEITNGCSTGDYKSISSLAWEVSDPATKWRIYNGVSNLWEEPQNNPNSLSSSFSVFLQDPTTGGGGASIRNLILMGSANSFDSRSSDPTYSNSSALTVNGNIENNTTASASFSNIILSSGSAQSVGGLNPLSFSSLAINGGGQKNLSQDITVTGAMTFSSGFVVPVSGKKVTFTSIASVSGANNSSFVKGAVQKIGFANGGFFEYPIGAANSLNQNYYQPVILTFPSGQGSATTTFTCTPTTQRPSDVAVKTYKVNNRDVQPQLIPAYLVDIHDDNWGTSDGQPNSGGVKVQLIINDNFNALYQQPILYVAHQTTDPSPSWEIPNITQNSKSLSNGIATLTVLGQKNFSLFGGASTSEALPVKISSFNLILDNNRSKLTWSTSSEQNNKGFEIQRSIGNTSDFKTIGFVGTRAKDGNSQTEIAYSFEDADVKAGQTHYYRLNQIDFDGKATLSPVRSVKPGSIESNLNVYPNPSQGSVTVNTGSATGKLNIYVLDNAGRMVNQYINVSTSNTRINNLKKGFYTLKLVNTETGEQSAQRVVVQ